MIPTFTLLEIGTFLDSLQCAVAHDEVHRAEYDDVLRRYEDQLDDDVSDFAEGHNIGIAAEVLTTWLQTRGLDMVGGEDERLRPFYLVALRDRVNEYHERVQRKWRAN